MNSVKYNEKKMNFINRKKYAENKIVCNCMEVYKIYEGNDFDKKCEAFLTLRKEIKNKQYFNREI